jgi:O-antigen/teichoic acid export membrane protein
VHGAQTDEQQAAAGAAPPLDGRRETELERYDRNLNELLSELRVALPGVQVLFAFLLVAPFNQRFNTVSEFERRLYFATLLCTMLASILLIAPTLVHRLQFRRRRKAEVVEIANRLMIAGLCVFAVAMTCALLLITHYLFGAATAIATTAIVAAVFALTWFALPLRSRRSWQRRCD